MKILYNFFVRLCVGWIFIWSIGLCDVWGSLPSCDQLYNQKQYLKSAQCFHAQAAKMKHGKQLDELDKAQKEEYLVRALRAMDEAIQQQTRSEEMSYLREKSVQMLDQILNENLCEAQKCKEHQHKRTQMMNQIGYAQLTIDTGTSHPTSVTIRGHRYVKEYRSPPSWSNRVRPGSYQLVVIYMGRPPAQSKTKVSRKIQVEARTSRRIVFELPAPHKIATKPTDTPKLLATKKPSKLSLEPKPPPAAVSSANPGAWVAVGVGTAVLLGGIITLGVGYTNGRQLDSLANEIRTEINESNNPEQTIQAKLTSGQTALGIREAHGSVQTAIITGWSILGIGTATTIGGVIWLLFPRKVQPDIKVIDGNKTKQNMLY